MQQILPLAIRNYLSKNIRSLITRLCFFFNSLCSKVIQPDFLDQLQQELQVTISTLEQYFLPTFFDIMVHLTVYLVEEVKLCGPVYLRWMFPFERGMKPINGYVRNRNRTEGCIAECYITEEALEFCVEYLSSCESIGLPSGCVIDCTIEKPLVGASIKLVDGLTLAQAHRCVLVNTPEVQPYIEEHLAFLQANNPRQSKNHLWLQNEHSRTFTDWLTEKVTIDKSNKVAVDSLIWLLANKPQSSVVTLEGYYVNGFSFATRGRDDNRVTQNIGVHIVAKAVQISSSKDKNPYTGDTHFYGKIAEFWQLDYLGVRKVLFKFIDEFGMTVVNLDRIGYKSDSFILAGHAKQVFYVKDQLDDNG
ncbi:hypothetical protein OROMI_003455 [Orobanche minor]